MVTVEHVDVLTGRLGLLDDDTRARVVSCGDQLVVRASVVDPDQFGRDLTTLAA